MAQLTMLGVQELSFGPIPERAELMNSLMSPVSEKTIEALTHWENTQVRIREAIIAETVEGTQEPAATYRKEETTSFEAKLTEMIVLLEQTKGE